MNATAIQKTEVPKLVILPTSEEAVLAKSVSSIERAAQTFAVQSDSDYENAASFGKDVKQMIAKVTAFFEPMKKAANKAHREICAREKEMLSPLSNAERTLKETMGRYIERVERERRKAEEEARRIAQEEADRKLAEAVELEESGDVEGAASAMIDAQIADSVSNNIYIPQAAPKVTGVTHSKAWEIVNISDADVPVSLNGMVLRPVDRAAVQRLIKMSKGQIKIPGVTYREKTNIGLRR